MSDEIHDIVYEECHFLEDRPSSEERFHTCIDGSDVNTPIARSNLADTAR
jgi:hypothetical protein